MMLLVMQVPALKYTFPLCNHPQIAESRNRDPEHLPPPMDILMATGAEGDQISLGIVS